MASLPRQGGGWHPEAGRTKEEGVQGRRRGETGVSRRAGDREGVKDPKESLRVRVSLLYFPDGDRER